MKLTARAIAIYKRYYNPLFASRCKYVPSCSAYMGQAVRKRGFLVGIAMGLWRIVRCNPFSRGGYDPVKDNFRGKAKWLL